MALSFLSSQTGHLVSTDKVAFYEVVEFLRANSAWRMIKTPDWGVAPLDFPIPIGAPIWTGTRISCSVQMVHFYRKAHFDNWDKTFTAYAVLF